MYESDALFRARPSSADCKHGCASTEYTTHPRIHAPQDRLHVQEAARAIVRAEADKDLLPPVVVEPEEARVLLFVSVGVGWIWVVMYVNRFGGLGGWWWRSIGLSMLLHDE